MKTRPVTFADIEHVVRLSRQVHDLHRHAMPERYRGALDEAEITRFFGDYLDTQDVHAWVAESEGEIVAYLSATFRTIPANPFRDAIRQFELDQVVVDENHRGSGAGRALLDAFMARAEELKSDELLVHTLHFNHAAQDFFRRCGFTDLSLNLWKPLGTMPDR